VSARVLGIPRISPTPCHVLSTPPTLHFSPSFLYHVVRLDEERSEETGASAALNEDNFQKVL